MPDQIAGWSMMVTCSKGTGHFLIYLTDQVTAAKALRITLDATALLEAVVPVDAAHCERWEMRVGDIKQIGDFAQLTSSSMNFAIGRGAGPSGPTTRPCIKNPLRKF